MTPKHLSRGLLPVDILALTLYHEAASEGPEGMAAVGSVIVNRASRRHQTVAEVCLARNQFSCWIPEGGATNHQRLVEHANLIRLGKRPAVLEPAYALAHALLEGRHDDPTRGADHYYAPAAMRPPGRVPTWAEGQTPSATIGRHIFFNLEGQIV